VGIAAAGIVDMSDKAAIKLDLHHFEGIKGMDESKR